MNMEVFPVEGLPLIRPGDNIARLICENTTLENGDAVVIASTIVAKAEGRIFSLEGVVPSEEAVAMGRLNGKDPRLVQAILDRSLECLTSHPVMLVQSKGAHVCINAGIDDSNVEDGFLAGLPEDADVSARKIGEGIKSACGCDVSVIITDTNGRAFRIGQTGVAIGLYRFLPVRDWKGSRDLFGQELKISEEAVADEVAATANLLMGEGDGGTPVIVVRGPGFYTERDVSARELYRPDEKDIIKKALRRLDQV